MLRTQAACPFKQSIKSVLKSACTCDFGCKHAAQEQDRQSYHQHHTGGEPLPCTAPFHTATSLATMLRGMASARRQLSPCGRSSLRERRLPACLHPAHTSVWAPCLPPLLFVTSCACTALSTNFRVAIKADASHLSRGCPLLFLLLFVWFLSRFK